MTTPLRPGTPGPTISVVIPTYNEADNLPRLIDRLLALNIAALRILVVDDNSPDGTGQVADRLAGVTAGRVSVLHRKAKDGLGRAYIAGMTRALANDADVVIQMDADLSHPVEAIPNMLQVLADTEAGVVIGSRYVAGGSLDEHWPLRRRLLSRWANAYVSTVLRLGVHDTTAGFKAWRADSLRRLDLLALTSNGYCFQIEMAYRAHRCGTVMAEIPIHFAQRTSGTSKMSLRVQAEAAVVPWRLRRSRWTPALRERDRGDAAVSGVPPPTAYDPSSPTTRHGNR